jgi:cytochrome c-type biogenesis protein
VDPVGAGLDAIARHDLVRLPAVFAAGVVTSVGPCVAPRYIAVAAVIERSAHRTLAVAAFVGGLLVAYAVLGFGIGVAGMLWNHATAIYLLLGCGLGASGLAVLARAPHAHAAATHVPARSSAVFLLGAASALIVSPCCTPIVAAVAGMAAFDGVPAAAAAFLATFAAGHALPLVLLGTTGSLVARRLAHRYDGGAAAVVSGTLLLALGAYYGMLA